MGEVLRQRRRIKALIAQLQEERWLPWNSSRHVSE